MTMNGFILEYQGKLAIELFVPIIQPLLPEVCKFFDGNDCVLDLFSLHLVLLLSENAVLVHRIHNKPLKNQIFNAYSWLSYSNHDLRWFSQTHQNRLMVWMDSLKLLNLTWPYVATPFPSLTSWNWVYRYHMEIKSCGNKGHYYLFRNSFYTSTIS